MNELDKLIERVQELRKTYLPTPSKFVDWHRAYAGCKICIEWFDNLGEEGDFPPMIDHGYIFLLPGQDEYHELDALFAEGVVHIPSPIELDGPEWVPMIDLLRNPLIKELRMAKPDE